MKKALLILLIPVLLPLFLHAQDGKPNFIKSSFYFMIGPVIPVGVYRDGQTITFHPKDHPLQNTLSYLPARTGAALDMGYQIYIGPAFANNMLRAGIDATFLSLWFNSTRPPDRKGLAEQYYSFVGQKFGPLFTLNPVDRLLINVSYKLNFNLGYHDELTNWEPLSDGETSEYGDNMLFQEISLGLSYRLLDVSFQYNFGKMNYNNLNKDNQEQKIDISTFRIMIGLKI